MNDPFLPYDCKETELDQEREIFEFRFDPTHVQAINIAVAAGRPLLVQGDPGVGKSELARATARVRDAAFVSTTLTAKTEADDLLYQFDAVARLATAQALGILGPEAAVQRAEILNEAKFTRPGILWWALNWRSAADHSTFVDSSDRCPFLRGDGKPGNGLVVLLDEIDKAESAVPNALLEALGSRRFVVPRVTEVPRHEVAPLLVMITTNDERALPDAFVRRCMVLKMEPPEDEELLKRGSAHARGRCDNAVLHQILECFRAERQEAAKKPGQRPPGQAEFLDAVHALCALAPRDDQLRGELLESIRQIAFQKHQRA